VDIFLGNGGLREEAERRGYLPFAGNLVYAFFALTLSEK